MIDDNRRVRDVHEIIHLFLSHLGVGDPSTTANGFQNMSDIDINTHFSFLFLGAGSPSTTVNGYRRVSDFYITSRLSSLCLDYDNWQSTFNNSAISPLATTSTIDGTGRPAGLQKWLVAGR